MAKGIVRKVVEWGALGCGVFWYRLSCGHSTSRVGKVPRGKAMEQPHVSCTCYACGAQNASRSNPHTEHLTDTRIAGIGEVQL